VEDNHQLPNFDKVKPNKTLDSILVTEQQVAAKIQSIGSSKSPGPDGLTSEVLKYLCPIICKPLAMLFNTSYENGQLPLDWKKANVIPIFKKGDRSEALNYRPVSLTSVVCKLAEKCLLDTLVPYCMSFGHVPPYQFGFTKGRSCQEQLLYCHNKWLFQLREHPYSSSVIYYDFRKAFDSVVHSKLLFKLEILGIGGQLLKWIGDFLRGRVQRVVIDRNDHSEWSPVLSGVPQGSVAGPFLFLLFSSDLCENLAPEVGKALFADDLKCFDNEPNRLQESVTQVTTWASKWQLPLNEDKLVCLNIGKPRAVEYRINGALINSVPCTRDLGVMVDSNLNFRDHVIKLSAEGHQMAGIILRNFRHLPKGILVSLFVSTVRSKLEYCSTLWSPNSKTLQSKLENVQRRFTKRLPGMSSLSYQERLKHLGLLTLKTRRRFLDLVLMYKIVFGLSCLPAQSLFSFTKQTYHHNLRGHPLKVNIPEPKNNREKASFVYRTAVLWNSLPQDVFSESFAAFKEGCLNSLTKTTE
jgi:hypothetical protein